MNDDRNDFCTELKRARERRGVTLEDVAEITKIRETWLRGLERGDIAQWPEGAIFRRAYVRSYALAIGLPPGPILADFERLFPSREADLALPASEDLPLPLPVREAEPSSPATPVGLPDGAERVLIFDLGAVAILSGLAAALSSLSVGVLFGGVALSYFLVGTLLCAGSPGRWALTRSDAFLQGWTRRAAEKAEMVELRQGGETVAAVDRRGMPSASPVAVAPDSERRRSEASLDLVLHDYRVAAEPPKPVRHARPEEVDEDEMLQVSRRASA